MIQLKEITAHVRETFQTIIRNTYDGDKYIHDIEIVTEHTIYDEDVLYICAGYKKLGWVLPVPKPGMDVYILTSVNHLADVPNTFKTIEFSKLPDAVTLYQSIKQMIKESSRLEHEVSLLYSALYRGNGLKDVITQAEQILHCPINVCDASYNFIETSPMMISFPYGMSHDEKRFYLSDEEIESLRRNNYEAMIYKQHSAFVIAPPDHPDNQWIFAPIRIQNVMMGYVAIAATLTHKVSSYELKLATALANICSVEMQKHEFFITRTGMKYETFLIDLLEGNFRDVNMISARLELLDRSFYKHFCILVFSCTEPHDSDLFNKHQMEQLRNQFPNSMSVVYKDAIILFVNQKNPIVLDDKPLQKVKSFAERNHMHVGISQPFTDILKIHTYYEQAANTLEIGSISNKESCLFLASELFPDYLFKCCNYTGIETGIHYHIHQLHDYDEEYHTEFVTTLRTYLECNRNTTKTAQALNLHRSTLFYRIKKIEELLGISFEDSKLMFLYELSFRAWDFLVS